MIKYLINIFFWILLSTSLPVAFISCSTGIERTKTVTLSRADKKFLQKSPEESFIDSISIKTLSHWHPGKRFMITDNKAALLYDVYDSQGRRIHGDSIKGYMIEYRGTKEENDAAGGKTHNAIFAVPAEGKTLTYRSRKDFEDLNNSTWSDFPFLVDMDVLEQLNARLKNRKVWIKTPLWTDENGIQVRGAKFIPVIITAISPGTGIFPIKVTFSTGMVNASVPMNLKSSGSFYESRTFPTLFSLTDPKLSYPGITPEVWALICEGDVAPGMTKEECKLSMGNPKDVESGHDWNSLMDYWKYDNGAYLMFQDGRLINFRK